MSVLWCLPKVITIPMNTYQRTVRLHNLSWISLACSSHSVLPFLLNCSSSVQESVIITIVVIVGLPVLRLALLALCCSQQSQWHTDNAYISKTLKIRIYKIMGGKNLLSLLCTNVWHWFCPQVKTHSFCYPTTLTIYHVYFTVSWSSFWLSLAKNGHRLRISTIHRGRHSRQHCSKTEGLWHVYHKTALCTCSILGVSTRGLVSVLLLSTANCSHAAKQSWVFKPHTWSHSPQKMILVSQGQWWPTHIDMPYKVSYLCLL